MTLTEEQTKAIEYLKPGDTYEMEGFKIERDGYVWKVFPEGWELKGMALCYEFFGRSEVLNLIKACKG